MGFIYLFGSILKCFHRISWLKIGSHSLGKWCPGPCLSFKWDEGVSGKVFISIVLPVDSSGYYIIMQKGVNIRLHANKYWFHLKCNKIKITEPQNCGVFLWCFFIVWCWFVCVLFFFLVKVFKNPYSDHYVMTQIF